MKVTLILLSLLLVAGCSEHYRYPCQDPENWKKEECNRPACEGDGMCWDTLSGVNNQSQTNDAVVEQTESNQCSACNEQSEENIGE